MDSFVAGYWAKYMDPEDEEESKVEFEEFEDITEKMVPEAVSVPMALEAPSTDKRESTL